MCGYRADRKQPVFFRLHRIAHLADMLHLNLAGSADEQRSRDVWPSMLAHLDCSLQDEKAALQRRAKIVDPFHLAGIVGDQGLQVVQFAG